MLGSIEELDHYTKDMLDSAEELNHYTEDILSHAKELGEVNDNIEELYKTEDLLDAMVKHFRART